MHVFVDESRRARYMVAAAIVPMTDLAGMRASLKGLRLPGQQRIHFRKESDRQRRRILSQVVRLSPTVWIFEAPGPEEVARAACLTAMVDDLTVLRPQHLILESRGDHRDRVDRRIIRAALEKSDHGVQYRHLEGRHEPLLWIPDVVAWAHGAGGEWSRRARPLVRKTLILP
ncbi:hypothetical protein AB0H57_32600 [Micromonospora sp. NPDC050686]|uniref:hypothetical protein n=1 Tax=Micromonospora sp. NPDC050686 TaxID=3154631 RepID=UPI0034101C7C